MSQHIEVDQRSPEWFTLKIGKFSASSFSDFFMKPSTAGYRNAIADIAFERMTGKSASNGYTNPAMQWGIDHEDEARESYELQTFNLVKKCGIFVMNDWVCASPDGIVGTGGLLEIKCPQGNTQMYYLSNNELPDTYFWQVHFQMYVAEKQWCDFFSYHPDLKPLLIRVNRDEAVIKQIQDKLVESIKEVNNLISKIK
jgi:putative phage-type endonuclease